MGLTTKLQKRKKEMFYRYRDKIKFVDIRFETRQVVEVVEGSGRQVAP